MRKNIIFLIAFFVVVGLIVAVLVIRTERSPTIEENDDTRTTEMIEAAFAGQISIRCRFEEDREGDSIAFVKDGYVRAETVNEYGQENMIFRDDVFYLWEEGQNQGIIVNSVPKGIDEEPFGDIREQLHGQEVTCQQESLADSLFDPPADVDFVDFVGLTPQQPAQIDN